MPLLEHTTPSCVHQLASTGGTRVAREHRGVDFCTGENAPRQARHQLRVFLHRTNLTHRPEGNRLYKVFFGDDEPPPPTYCDSFSLEFQQLQLRYKFSIKDRGGRKDEEVPNCRHRRRGLAAARFWPFRSGPVAADSHGPGDAQQPINVLRAQGYT